MRALSHTARDGWADGPDVVVAADRSRTDGGFSWVEVELPHEDPERVREVAERFDLDPLAVEDALNPRQRPKLETYEWHRFVVLDQLDEEDDQLEARQIACFAGPRFLLILHNGAGRLVGDGRKRLQQVEPDDLDVDRALHALVDAVVDDHQRIADRLEIDVEDLEAQALRVSRRSVSNAARNAEDLPSQPMLYAIKQQVSMLRRYALPLNGVLEALQAGAEAELDADGDGDDRTDLLFRDVHDHVLRIGGQIRNVDDLATAVIDLTRSVQADMLNEVNKKLSAWAAIIAIPTLIASVYGTNYKLWPDPDIGSRGFVGVVLIMFGAGAALWLFFKRKRWI